MTTRAAVVGVGHSRMFRRDEVPLGQLALEACRNAIADAGLKPADIDGVCTNPEQGFEDAGSIDGINIVTPGFVEQALGLRTRWGLRVWASTVLKAFATTVDAVAAGRCNYAVVFRAIYNPKGRYGQGANPAGYAGNGQSGGGGQFTGPYGVTAPANAGLVAQRYFHKYAAKREMLGTFLVNNRKNALLWEWGYWYQHRPEPLTLDQYMNAPDVCWPLGLYDCDLPVHACGAWVITTPERARDLRHRPAYVRGMATPYSQIPNRTWNLEEFEEGGKRVAENLFESARIGPSDIGVANLYDGFSIFVPLWAEALGLAAKGEGLAFLIREESRIGGRTPINTSSGNLGHGRMPGVAQLMESVLQVMGRSGARQAKHADISVATAGLLTEGQAIAFGRDPA